MKKSLDSGAVVRVLRELREAADMFDSRWTLGALARADAALAERLQEQIQLYQAAQITGTMGDLREHAAAMRRGYIKAAAACEASGLEDDAYVLGLDTATGLRVAIGDKRASAVRVAELHGGNVVWLNPDEVARLWASIQGLRRVDAIKELWPGAEVTDIRPHTRDWLSLAESMPEPPPEDDDDDMVTLEIGD